MLKEGSKNSNGVKFVFFGTRGLGAVVLEKLVLANLRPVLVVTAPDKPVGRKQVLTPSPVKVMAQKYGIPVFQSESIQDTKYQILNTNPELIVLAAYGNILPKELVELPPRGALNVHPSLLPKYRGPSPERGTLLNGDEKTGVTVILMDEQIDHGPILAQEEFVVPEGILHEELHAALGEIGGELLVKTIPQWFEGKITPREQNHSQATYTKKLTKEDGRIDWNQPALYIARQVRAFHPWPGTYTSWQGKLLKILKANARDAGEQFSFTPGTSIPWQEGFAVVAGQGILVIEQLQLEGKNPVSAKDFLLGHKDFLGTILS